MPDESEETARVLCEAGSLLKAHHPKEVTVSTRRPSVAAALRNSAGQRIVFAGSRSSMASRRSRHLRARNRDRRGTQPETNTCVSATGGMLCKPRLLPSRAARASLPRGLDTATSRSTTRIGMGLRFGRPTLYWVVRLQRD